MGVPATQHRLHGFSARFANVYEVSALGSVAADRVDIRPFPVAFWVGNARDREVKMVIARTGIAGVADVSDDFALANDCFLRSILPRSERGARSSRSVPGWN
jgi:hypothetical protein